MPRLELNELNVCGLFKSVWASFYDGLILQSFVKFLRAYPKFIGPTMSTVSNSGRVYCCVFFFVAVVGFGDIF